MQESEIALSFKTRFVFTPRTNRKRRHVPVNSVNRVVDVPLTQTEHTVTSQYASVHANYCARDYTCRAYNVDTRYVAHYKRCTYSLFNCKRTLPATQRGAIFNYTAVCKTRTYNNIFNVDCVLLIYAYVKINDDKTG